MSKSVKLVFEAYKSMYQVLTDRLSKSLDEVDDLKANKRKNELNLGNSIIFKGMASFEAQKTMEIKSKTSNPKHSKQNSPKSKRPMAEHSKSIDLQQGLMNFMDKELQIRENQRIDKEYADQAR